MATDSTAGRDFSGQESATNALQPASGEAFRDAIARLPSGVNIVTTAGSAGKAGFTATAVASVSDDPPTVLVCLNRKSPQNRLIRENAQFAVQIVLGGILARAIFRGVGSRCHGNIGSGMGNRSK